MKRICAAALAMALLLCACGIQAVPAEEGLPSRDGAPIVGFAQLGEESAWRLANTASIMDAASDAEIELMYSNAQQDQENQIKAVRSFIAYRVDAIVLAPIVETGWEAVLLEAKDNGIPVILEDRRVDGTASALVTAWTGSDFRKAGEEAASFLQRKMRGVRGPINVVELTGTAGSTAAEHRHQGFWSTLASDSRFEPLACEAGDFMLSKGREVMRKVIEENDPRDIDVLFSHNDDMTLGAIEAMEEAGLVPGKDIVIITVDAQQKVIDLLKEGKVNCAIECNPYLGQQVFDLVSDVLDGKQVPTRTYSVEHVFTEFDDVDDLPARGY